jgi:hypothetical protein
MNLEINSLEKGYLDFQNLEPNLSWLALFTAKAVVTKGLKKWDRSSCD